MSENTRAVLLTWNDWVNYLTAKYSRLSQLNQERGETERARYFADYVVRLNGQRDRIAEAVTMPP